MDKNKVSDSKQGCVFCSRYGKYLANKYCRQKVSGSINFKLFTIFPTTYVRISPQTVSKESTIFYIPVVPGT